MAINSLSASSYGISGMVSGMNTQEMVEKMLSGTKSKITAQQQKKAQLEYKQDLYRGLASQLRALKDSYFSFQSGSATNLYSSSFFNNMTATTTSKYFTATATSSSSTGTSRIDYIKQLATAATLQGTKKASGRLKGEMRVDTGGAGSLLDAVKTFKENNVGSLKFTVDGGSVGGESVEIELTKEDITQLMGMNNSEAAQKLNTLFEQKAADAGRAAADVVVKYSNGKMTFASQNGGSISISGDDKGLALVGFSGTTVSSNGKLDTAMNVNKLLPSINVSVDGATSKAIYFNPDKYLVGDDYATAIQKSLQDALDTAFGHVIEVGVDRDSTTASNGDVINFSQFTFDIAGNDPSRRFEIYGAEDSLNILGIKTGASNKITQTYYLDEINFADKLEGNVFKFTINDVDFNITGNTTLSSLMTQINSSDANVKLTYNKDTDKFALVSKTEGSGARIKVSQEQGNLLTALLGSDVVSGNTEVKGKELTVPGSSAIDATYSNTDFKENTYGSGTIAFNVVLADGKQRSISLRIAAPDKSETGSEYFQSKEQMIEAINEALAKDETAKAGDIRLHLDDAGQVSVLANSGVKVETSTGGSGSFLTVLGFTNMQSNAAKGDTTLQAVKIKPGEIKVGGTALNDILAGIDGTTVSETTTMDELAEALTKAVKTQGDPFVNASVVFDASEGAFHVKGVDASGTLSGYALLQITAESTDGSAVKLFGSDGKMKFTAQSSGTVQDGQDAILSYNGTEVRRSSNKFSMDGVSYTLTGVFDGRTTDANGNHQLADGSASVRNDGIMVDKTTGEILNATLKTIFDNLESGHGGTTTPVHGAQLDDHGRLVDSNGKFIGLNGDQVDEADALNVIDGGGYLLIDESGNRLLDGEGNPTTGPVVTASPDAKYVYDEVAGDTTVTRNTQQIFEGIMKFVEDYNKIMESIHTLLTEKPEYKDYLPLTDEQKAAMSDREVELWEEKAKTGLLRGDSYLNDIWDNLRATLYKKPSNSNIAIYDLGITTQFDTEFGGQLVVDQPTLKAMLESNAEDVATLFSGSTVDSLGKLMSDALDRASSSSIASPGILTQVAGASSRTDTSSNLYKQMKSIDDNLESLFDRYDSEYSRYWKQFNAMEQMIQQMNQQSSWLSQQFA